MNNYYDFAASTPVSDVVLAAMAPWWQLEFANSLAAHSAGEKVNLAVQQAREVIAERIGALPSEIIFTSGASEGNNLAIKGTLLADLARGERGHIVTTAIEHKCVLNTCAYLESLGFSVTYVMPQANGVVAVSDIAAALREDTRLISVMQVNNEIGTLQPITEIGALAFAHGIKFHTDAAQSFGKLAIDVDALNVDMLSLSGHKIYGPKGIGVLYVRDARECKLVPQIHGANHELGLRAGTHATPLIMGLAAAVANFPTAVDAVLPGYARAEVLAQIARFNGTVNFAAQAVDCILSVTFAEEESRAAFFAANPWAVSRGSACNAATNSASHVLKALGFDEAQARLTYRISLPPHVCAG
ncbi:MAG: cysteine desulfurase family protein [Aeromonas sp.]